MMKAGATVKLETTSQFTRRKGRLAGPSVFVPPESPLSGKKRHVRENWHDDVSHHLKKRGSRGKKDASREERIETAASGEENLEIVTPGWKNLQSVPTGEENLNSASAGGENLEVLAIDGENFDSSAAGGDNLELEVIGGENLETVANSGESFDSAATGGDNFIFGAAGGEDSELAVTDDAGGSYQELTELQDVKISEEMPDVWGSPLQPKASEDYSYCLPGSMSEAMGSLQQQSDSQNNPASSPTTSDDSKPKKMVFFNDSGQPIGEGSAPFVTYLGSLARIHCPIIYEKWRDVPNDIKEMIWKLVTGEYNVCISYKDKILRKLNIYWRGFKCELRAKHYDMYDTDEERKSHCPRGVIQEDWDTFVDNQSTPTAQARRGRGKSARKAMKNPHTSGRLGAARTAEKLKKGDPIATITRTELFLATHCRKDGSCLNPEISEQVEQVKAIVAKDPSSIHLDLDHDPVAQVFGREKKGCVRGLGEGVSKSGYLYSFPARDQLLQERRMQLYIQEQIASQAQLIDDLRQQIAAQAQMTAELREMITAQAFYNQSQAPVDPSPPVERLCQLVERPCELLYFGGAIVATGKLLCGGSHDDMGNHPNADVYEVTVDVIHDAKASLFSPDGDVSVLGNVQAGETISWPRIFTRFVL